MTMLANACAGQNREKITDRIDAHDAYARFRAAVYRGEIVEARNTEDNLLVTASFDAVDVRPISLQRLVELRSREDALMRELRAKYRKAIAKAKENLAKATNLVDKSDVFHDFKRGMSDDFEELRKALRMEAVKSFVAPLLLCLICLAGGVPPKPALAASAIAAIPSFRLARKKTLKEHETAWLYAASNKIPTV